MIAFKQDCCPCDCQPRIIASYVTHGQDPSRKVWDLRPYQEQGIGTPCGVWRIWERSYNNEYTSGKIDKHGVLVGLPSEFTSNYYYEGYMELQQGCCPSNTACCKEWDALWPS